MRIEIIIGVMILPGKAEFLSPTHTPVSRLFDESEDETKELN